MSDVAYNERDIKAIEKRERINFFYRAFRKVFRILTGFKNKQIKTITTYPMIDDEITLVEIVNKLAWAFPKKAKLALNILVDKKLEKFNFSTVKEIPNQRNYLNIDISHIKLITEVVDFDLVLFTDAKALLKNPWWVHKSEILDKNYFSYIEGIVLKKGFSHTLEDSEHNRLENLSQKNFQIMYEKNNNRSKSYCFVTGPSFDRYKEFNYEQDSLKVICNSTVKNDEFLEYIGGPDILTFADPVFHFSPSEYSAVFRDEVLKVYKKYKPYIIVPLETVGLLLAHYPELEDRIIGIKGEKCEFTLPSLEKLAVKNSSNILTLYMLPVASTITNEINIIGADGRNPDEKYFWKHSKSAQFGDLMNTVFETHPSFFRDRDYKDYYDDHCQFLNDLIEFGESKGKKYFSLTESFIPVLKKRYKND